MRETRLEIDRKKILHNLEVFRSIIHPDTQILVNLKGNAYGLGAVEIGKLLEQEQISYFSVAYINEGILLRKNGIQTHLIVFNPSFEHFQPLVEYKLEPEVSSIAYLQKLINFLKANNIRYFPVHLKLDTGMHRAGIMPHELESLIDLLKRQNQVKIQSVFSHLAASEDPGEDDFSHSQIRLFEQMSNQLSQSLPYTFFRHLLNTAGVFRFPQAQYDMIRPGLGIFGYNLIRQSENPLLPVAQWSTRINQIKTLSKGESVGYNCNYTAPADNTKIALLPVGYADGLNRLLGQGKYQVLCKSKRAPIIGNISMDTCSIDVTGTDCQAGDQVILFNRKQDVYRMASLLNTIAYEIITGITQRVIRKIQ